MMIMTARLSKTKIAAVLVILVIIAAAMLFLLRGGGEKDGGQQAEKVDLSTNEGRIAYLASYGWELEEKPVETQEILIPAEMNEVYARYNELQKSQGFDLTAYAGKQAKRYVYQVKNYPNADAPVYATLLICRGAVIGGDITSTCGKGSMHGFTKPAPASAVDPAAVA